VSKTAVRKKDASEAAVLRLTGRAVPVSDRVLLEVNAQIAAEMLTLSEDGGTDTEAHGRLLVFPLDEGKRAAELHYYLPEEGVRPATAYTLRFHPQFFQQWSEELLNAHPAFRFDRTAEQQFPIDGQAHLLLEDLSKDNIADELSRSLHRAEVALHLLRRAIEAVAVPFTVCPVPACRFLAFETEREKVFAARDLLLTWNDRPLTIKDLARKVAMNECYLKKGFKALTGKTVHEFQHERRMTRAKELLQEGNLSVSDVAAELGFLSISHFSTAFKKATGMKACDLLR
jgi:AraC-like DNA-binding protein